MGVSATKVSEAYSKTKAVIGGKIEQTQVQKAQRKRNTEAISNAAKLTPDTVVDNLKTVKLQVTSTFDDLTNTLITKFGNVKEIDEAIEAKKAQLKELHDLQEEADALAILLETKKVEKERAQLEQQETRAAWAAEKVQHDKEDKTYRDELVTRRRREEEQYQYETKKLRQSQQDAVDAQRRKDEQAFADFIAQAEADLAAKAKVFADADEKIKALEAKVVEVEAATEKKVAKEVAIATNALKSNLTHTFELERKDFQNKIQNLETELSARNVRIQELDRRNEELNAKYTASIDKVQQIAEKAIDGASKQAVVVQAGSHEPSVNETSNGRKR